MLTCGFHAGAFVSDTRWSGGGTCGEKHWGVQEDTNWSWACRVHIWGFSCGKKSRYGAESDSGNAQHFLAINLSLFHKLSHYLHLTIPLLDAKNFSLCGLLLIWGMWDKISTRAWWSHHPHFRGVCTHCWFLTKLVIHDHWYNNVICIVICVWVLVVVFISALYCAKGFRLSGHFLFLSLQETGLLVSLCCAVFCELDRESFLWKFTLIYLISIGRNVGLVCLFRSLWNSYRVWFKVVRLPSGMHSFGTTFESPELSLLVST